MNILTESLIILAVALTAFIGIQHFELKDLKSEIATYQQQILMLKLDSEEQEANTKQAYVNAQTQIKQIQNKTQAILRTKVPSNCGESIKWLIKQAHSL